MLGMIGMSPLQFEVHESPGQLDQPLVKGIIASQPTLLEPEMLEYIVRLIVEPPVETLEIPQIAGIESGAFIRAQRRHKTLDAIGLFQNTPILNRKTNPSKPRHHPPSA